MISAIRYISTKQQFLDVVEAVLDSSNDLDIIISGVWARAFHESVIEMILDKQLSSSCKIIIPKLLFKGEISLNLLRKVCKGDGQVRVNNNTTNNIMIINEYVFVLSFSSRLNSLNMLNTTFECAVMTNDEGIVSELRTQFKDIFENSILFRM